MKNLFYLPIIVILFLSGCKGHSFLKQRYTHFKHAPADNTKEMLALRNHASLKEKQALTENGTLSENLKSPEVFKNANYTQTLAEKPTTQTTQKQGVQPLFNFNTSDGVYKKISPEISHKKIVKEKSSTQKAIIGTLFKIVMYVVILAVVIAIILLVLLL